MKTAKTLEELEEHWHDFLRRLERVWSKSASHYSRSPKWSGWKGTYEKERSSDPLLSYLINARGAEEHTVAPVLGKEPGSIKINPGPSGSVHIKRMEMRADGSLMIESDDDLNIIFEAARVKLLPITNRGRVYAVPAAHQGQPLNPDNVIDVASTALAFYERFLAAAEAAFVK